jgi:hypothetical protein
VSEYSFVSAIQLSKVPELNQLSQKLYYKLVQLPGFAQVRHPAFREDDQSRSRTKFHINCSNPHKVTASYRQ